MKRLNKCLKNLIFADYSIFCKNISRQQQLPMKNFVEIQAENIKENVFQTIGKQWMLLTAGNKNSFNCMTVSWGAMGILFNKPVVIVFVRPQRYTFEFLEREDYFTLTTLPEDKRDAYMICGRKSGRDCDKIKESNITPIETESGLMTFNEGEMVLECKKIYGNFFNPEGFIPTDIIPNNFAAGDFHKVYIAEISKVWKKQ